MSEVAKAQHQIPVKQYGQNLVVVIEKTQYSRRFPDKAERDGIIDLIKGYNESNSQKKMSKIITAMVDDKQKATDLRKTIKESYYTTKETKTVEKPKEAEAPATSTMIEAAKSVLKAAGYVISKVAPKKQRGEY